MTKFPAKIAVIGVGLIGGSIALGLKKTLGAKVTIYGLCRDKSRSRKAVSQKIIDRAVLNLKSVPIDTGLIILALPVGEIIKTLHLAAKTAHPDTVIIDVGSTKREILDAARKFLPAGVTFIATHPMAGREKTGFENADPDLFRSKPWIICTDNLRPENPGLDRVKTLLALLGAKPVMMKAVRHDLFVSRVSHVQLALSSVLINSLARHRDWKEMTGVASSGFRDSTRGASHNPDSKADIILSNRQNIINALSMVQNEIRNFKKMLQTPQKAKIAQYFLSAKKIRDNYIIK